MPLEEVRANHFLTEKPVYDSIPDKYCKSEVVRPTPRVVGRDSVCPRFFFFTNALPSLLRKQWKKKTNVNCAIQVRKEETTYLL